MSNQYSSHGSSSSSNSNSNSNSSSSTDNNAHFQRNSYNNQNNNLVHNIDPSSNTFKAPLPKPYHLPQRQVTMWETEDRSRIQPNHTRRASETIQKSLISQTLFPYQPMSGIHALSPTDNSVQQMYVTEPDEDPMQHLVLLPLGKTGAGKSSLLNIMLGYNEFKAKAAAKSVTDCITERTGMWTIDQTETVITIADTPGFADSMNRDEQFLSSFQDYILDIGQRLGIDSFLLVFQCDSATNNIMLILDHFNSMMEQKFPCQNNWWDHVMLVFTRVDYFPNLKFPANILGKKQSIMESLIPDIQAKYRLKAPPKYAFVSSKTPNCSFNKKGQCDCFAASKYHLDQMRTLKSRINSILTDNGGRWVPA